MPTITSITLQKSKKRVNIYLDDKFGFGLDLDNFVGLNLKVEQQLSQQEVEEIVNKGQFKKTFDNLLRFATLRPRSSKEIKDYFGRKKVHESIHTKLLKRLKKLELIDDEKFARWWVDQRLSFKLKSKKDLTFELRGKGIDRETIKTVLDESEIDEVKVAKKLLVKKEYKWSGLPPREGRQKRTQYLAGKGFGWDVIEKVVSKE